jgi:hypothetical protein
MRDKSNVEQIQNTSKNSISKTEHGITDHEFSEELSDGGERNEIIEELSDGETQDS